MRSGLFGAAIGGRGNSGKAGKLAGKEEDIPISQLLGDRLDGKFGGPEHLPGVTDAAGDGVAVG